MKLKKGRGFSPAEEADVEDAIVKIGESEGKFEEIRNLEIERDHQFPVRVTLQFYKSTANGVADEDSMKTIADQIESARKFADNVGSLVVGGHTNRPTEHKVHPPEPSLIYVPPWWKTFWLTYGSTLVNHISEEEAKQVAFSQGGRAKWEHSTLQGEKQDVLARLRKYCGMSNPTPPPVAVLPVWDPLDCSEE